MKGKKLRSNCPTNFSLQMVGDKWSMLIIRDLMFSEKRTYGELLSGQEKIATNILAKRLVDMEANGLINKSKISGERRKFFYSLTSKGIDLLPLILEMMKWGNKYGPDSSKEDSKIINKAKRNKDGSYLKELKKEIAKGQKIKKVK